MKATNVLLRASAFTTALLAGCSTINPSVNKEIDRANTESRRRVAEPPVQLAAPEERVSVVKGQMMPAVATTGDRGGEWLRRIQVKDLNFRNPVPLDQIVANFAARGINIVSDLPLNTYSYAGTVNPTDADTALRMVLRAVGLDYQVDDARKVVFIRPMASRTWHLNIDNRRSTYSTDKASNSSNMPGTTAAGAGGFGATPGGAMGQPGGYSGSAGNYNTGFSAPGTQGATNGLNGQSATGVVAKNDFWSSLERELEKRLMVMIPRGALMQRGAPAVGSVGALTHTSPANAGFNAPGAAPGQQGTDQLYVARKVGEYALNPDTGTVWIQAPSWMLAEFDADFKRIQEMYNSELTFIGEVVLVTNSRSDSEGIDWSAITRWANGKYGAVVSNNALGGVTISLPAGGGAPAVAAAAQAVGGPLVGLTYTGVSNALELFNAYLSEIGRFSIIQRPQISTASGVTGVFTEKDRDYYITVTQNAAAGNAGAATTATQNVLVPYDTGTELRVSPRLDVITGIIRAHLDLDLMIPTGSRTVNQVVTSGNAITTVPTTVPRVKMQRITGEVLMKDGDLIIVGGQAHDSFSADANGLPNEADPVGGLFGSKKATKEQRTYYFALRAIVNKRQ